uniref:RING-type domain-containing protein n=1 Tax=Panagrellus redivivus TaxID=6233 RepID=A0A7E4UN42_PANRE
MASNQQIATTMSTPINEITDPTILHLAQCLICSQTYNKSTRAPIVVNCGHTYCRECIEKVTFNNVFKCFECRAPSCVENGFKTNKAMLRGLKSMKLLATDDTMEAVKVPEVVDKKTKLVNALATKVTKYLVQDDDTQFAVETVVSLLNHLLTESLDRRDEILESECLEYFVSMFSDAERESESKKVSPVGSMG